MAEPTVLGHGHFPQGEVVVCDFALSELGLGLGLRLGLG